MLEQQTDDDSIIQRLRDYGVIRVARLLLENQGAEWCLAMLAACDRKARADGDPIVASRWCRKFAKNPDGYDPDRGRNKPAKDDYEDRENDYHKRRERRRTVGYGG